MSFAVFRSEVPEERPPRQCGQCGLWSGLWKWAGDRLALCKLCFWGAAKWDAKVDGRPTRIPKSWRVVSEDE